ncbi:MAG: hypothetical protein PUK24_06350 [Elusimicrobia bacterium]|nr:hypothetical protein [Elusimicrobiota bacterium]MDD7579146.1 hypothetical protein [Elusimicrobiota bacterium]MDY6039758.1 hypothetical protein [Elusimicrobiaceae bacterium]
MKKILIVVFAVAMAAACSSNKSNVKAEGVRTADAKNAKYQIIDQEFDNLLAPEADYDTLPAYELQACGDSYLPPAETKLKNAVKPAAKKVTKKSTKKTEVTNNKEVVNIVNVYEIDGPAPVPPGTVSSTTTTTTTSSNN